MPAVAEPSTLLHRVRWLLREVSLFGLIGGLQLLVDWLCFAALTFAGMPVVSANIISRIVGACLGFWLNGRYTFIRPDRGVRLGRVQLLRFVIVWLTTAVMSTFAVWLLASTLGFSAVLVGKLVIDGALAGLSFLLSKYWVYR